jgi:hypothetical protein
MPFAYAAEHLDYGYALTGHAAQGLTADHAYVLFHDQGTMQEWGYVACSRARTETRLYLADHSPLDRETPIREPDPGSPPERAARALQHSSAEPLALDQRRERGDAILNYLAQQQAELDRYSDRTTDRLEAAELELAGLHWWNRDRRAELMNEIALGQASLERLDRRREQLDERTELLSENLALAQSEWCSEIAPSISVRCRRMQRSAAACPLPLRRQAVGDLSGQRVHFGLATRVADAGDGDSWRGSSRCDDRDSGLLNVVGGESARQNK